MSDAKKFLFLLDVDKIQGYIFNTNRLKTIIGASRLIDYVNADKDGPTFKLLKENPEFSGVPDPASAPGFILSAGGNTKLLFDNKGNALDFERKIRKAYAKNNIPVTTRVEEVYGNLDGEILMAAEKKLAAQKYAKTSKLAPVGAPHFKICDLCGKDYAGKKRTDNHGSVDICLTCDHKFEESKKRMRLFPDFIFQAEIQKNIDNDLMAVVVMDGNRMGDKIKALQDLDQLRRFASRTESIFQEQFLHCLNQFFSNDYQQKKFEKIRPLILAGDDVCFIITAEKAIDFAGTFSQKIHEASLQHQDLFGKSGICMSCGILFAKPNYPFNFAHRIAESLLRSAKRYSRGHDHCDAMDFHFLLSSSGDEIEKTREREYTYTADGGEHVLTAKPYLISDIADIKKDLKSLKTSLKARSKQKYIRQVLRWGREASSVELLKLGLRMNPSNRAEYIRILNKYGWRQSPADGNWHTGLLDLVELADVMEV